MTDIFDPLHLPVVVLLVQSARYLAYSITTARPLALTIFLPRPNSSNWPLAFVFFFRQNTWFLVCSISTAHEPHKLALQAALGPPYLVKTATLSCPTSTAHEPHKLVLLAALGPPTLSVLQPSPVQPAQHMNRISLFY